jgi:hypothetical protein
LRESSVQGYSARIVGSPYLVTLRQSCPLEQAAIDLALGAPGSPGILSAVIPTELVLTDWARLVRSPGALYDKILRLVFLLCGFAAQGMAQGGDETQTMRPVIRGRQAAVSSMRAQATEAAQNLRRRRECLMP